MAIFNEPTQWTHTLGSAADVSNLPDDTDASTGLASLQKLWQQINQLPLNAGGIAPARTDFNALFKLLGDCVFYAMQGGVASYNATYDYPAGALVKYNNQIYFCVKENGASSQAVTPGSDRTVWAQVAPSLPPGTITPFAGTSTVPDGYLLCNGAQVSRVTYADLFTAIGTSYGAGDGSSTFTLPDFRDRVLQGASGTHSTGSYISAGLPNISGDLRGSFTYGAGDANTEGATFWYYGDRRNPGGYQPATLSYQIPFTSVASGGNQTDMIIDAALWNSLYGSSTTVQPSATAVQYLIKY